MHTYKGILFITIVSTLILTGCQYKSLYEQRNINESIQYRQNLPSDLWLSSASSAKIDSFFSYANTAQERLHTGDTLGAEIYFNLAFEVLAAFSEADQYTLMKWDDYDSLFHTINEQYELIYLSSNETLEAEEVRHAISDYEMINLADSVLYGSSTVIDSSGDIPITINRRVRLAIKYFQTKGRFVFTKWLERSGKYEPIIRGLLKKHEMPQDLLYLPMIESGFNPRARSYARAVGLWQFIAATGRAYGLRYNWWFDERRDVIKATEAAIEHLKDLHARFGNWYLALAGYNCSPRRVDYNIRRYNSRNFWDLRRLPRQTRNYVPTFLAAAIIAKNPKKFGFVVDKLPAIQIDTIRVSESIDLNLVADLTDTSYAYIRELNPAVLRWVTPPNVNNFTLYLPAGKKEAFKEGYEKIPEKEKRSWVRHRIRSGETLSTIAARYHTSMSVIKSINGIRGSLIRAGHYLLIPVPQNKAHRYSYTHRTQRSRSVQSGQVVSNVPGHEKKVYVVKPGDTLGEIAELYNTRASKIRRWNGLRYGEYIYPDQKLNIWVPEKLELAEASVSQDNEYSSDGQYYTVRRGDTLWDIAKRYGLSVQELKTLNNIRSVRIRPGDRLRISKQ